VRITPDGKAYVEIRNLPASEVLVLTNHPVKDEGTIIATTGGFDHVA
jgi:hypothetical protein